MSEERIPKREDVDPKYTWALEDIYASDELWQADLEKLKAVADEVKKYKGKLSENGENLLDLLKISDEISVLCDSLGNYAQRKSDEDTANAKYQAMVGQLMNVFVGINSSLSFETPEIVAIDDNKLEEFYNTVPELELYRKHLTKMRKEKDHILSDAE